MNCNCPITLSRSSPEGLADMILKISYQIVDTLIILVAEFIKKGKTLFSGRIILAFRRHSFCSSDQLTSSFLIE
jgi:hypothetical protein